MGGSDATVYHAGRVAPAELSLELVNDGGAVKATVDIVLRGAGRYEIPELGVFDVAETCMMAVVDAPNPKRLKMPGRIDVRSVGYQIRTETHRQAT